MAIENSVSNDFFYLRSLIVKGNVSIAAYHLFKEKYVTLKTKLESWSVDKTCRAGHGYLGCRKVGPRSLAAELPPTLV